MRSSRTTLWIPEKPSVAKELAAAIIRVKRASVVNAKTVMKDGFFELSSGDLVCSVFGHMLQMLPPSRYFTKEQNTDPMPHLPLIPSPFRMEPQPERNKDGSAKTKNDKPVPSARFTLLEKLIKKASVIVNGCDIDREGQLIFDELLEYVGRDPYGPDVFRTSIVSMTPEALEACVRDLEKNGDKKWVQRGAAAATRQKMDWLLGMNASMAYQGVTGIRSMSVGRVQTPVLAMVVTRDLQIENFKPQTYFVPVVLLDNGTVLTWEKREGAESQPGFDPNGRIIDKAFAQSIADRIKQGASGKVVVSEQKERRETPPLPFSMGTLQSEASKRHGLTVADVTKAAQNLYEKHKAITYVGTDCRYLPEKMHDEAQPTLTGISSMFPEKVSKANPALKSKAFDDKKVDEHFAIIPTGKAIEFSPAERAEKAVFETIAMRYLAQFYPDHRSLVARLVVFFGQDEFRASASQIIDLGWKEIEGAQADEGEKEGKEGAANKNTVQGLDAYVQGEIITATKTRLDEGVTKAPPRYTESTLIRDMENAWRFGKNAEEKAVLKQTEGIGTARTREPTLANLLRRELIVSRKVKKNFEITSSEMGRTMVGRLPSWLTDVGTTAKWETLLSAIEKGEADSGEVLQSQIAYVVQVVERARTQMQTSGTAKK